MAPFLNSLVVIRDRWTCPNLQFGSDRCWIKVTLRQGNNRGDPHGRRSHPTAGGLGRRVPAGQEPDFDGALWSTRTSRAARPGHKDHAADIGVLVEVCAGSNSALTRHVNCLDGLRAHRVTEVENFLKPETLDRCMELITKPGDFVWFSIPCTGGSPWQIPNVSRGGQAAEERVQGYVALMRKLWNQAKKLIAHAVRVGAMWAVEWPHLCRYWTDKSVVNFLKHQRYDTTTVDGCMYGLTAKRKSHAGMLMRKRWKIISNSGVFLDGIHRRCNHGAESHAHVEGTDTRLTEGYTEELVQSICTAWQIARSLVSP